MTGLSKAQLLKRIVLAYANTSGEISTNRDGLYGRGLASEGYAAGYRDALGDVEALLRHGMATDARGYWRTSA